MNGDDALFATTFSNALQFNSAIVYPCSMLYAANIPKQFTIIRGTRTNGV
jgi:3-polyprenyl-4-hydroxybenzoate decarboxylase